MEQAPSAATLVQAVRAHAGEVTCLDAGGARLATGGSDRALRLWEWRTAEGWYLAGETRAAHRYGVVVVRWARGGTLLASGGVDGAVRVWCGRSLAIRRQLAAPGATAVRAVCWAGGGAARLLAGHDDGALCVWAPTRAAGGELLARLRPHEGALHALAVPARDALLLTACTDGVLKVFDLAEVCACGVAEANDAAPAPVPLQWVDNAHDLGALCADTNEAGEAATGGHDALVRVWCPAQGDDGRVILQADCSLKGHTAAVTAVRWARGTCGRNVLASAALDRTARLWAASVCLLAVEAHPRYLTCVVLAPDLRYMVTGSNDKSFRTWSLGSFSLDDELKPPCVALTHFALGDLEGIGPVEDKVDDMPIGANQCFEDEDEREKGSGARRVCSVQAHTGPINCISTWEDLLATASSDSAVKVWRWCESTGALEELHTLGAREYPALACDLAAAGTVLLSGGLDGGADLWDVQTGVCVRSLVVPGARDGGGGGSVRGARLSPHRAPLALFATDDGLAALWRLTDSDPLPLHVYAGHTEAATCCAWSADGRIAAVGAASGELQLYAPPHPRLVHHESHAHDLGVLSCDFAPVSPEIELPESCYLLATGGCDSLVKLWRVELVPEREGEGWGACVQLVRAVSAHGGGVASVRWGAGSGSLLATAGADRWARVWRVALIAGGSRVDQSCAVPVQAAGGAPAAVIFSRSRYLAVGSLSGELALWRLAEDEHRAPDDDGAAPRFWCEAGVARWLRDYVLNAPGSSVPAATAAALEARVLSTGVTGARLLQDPLDELLDLFGFDKTCESGIDDNGCGSETREDSVLRGRARDELQWLRASAATPPGLHLERLAPHALLCPLSHRLLAWPVRAADGFTYERANMMEWLAAAGPDGAVSPVSGRRLRCAALAPNYGLQTTLRAFLQDAARRPPDVSSDADGDATNSLANN